MANNHIEKTNERKKIGKVKEPFKLIFTILTLMFLSLSIISAAGVSTPYWNTNPLKLQPGESTIFSLGLQNMVGTDDITLRANITKGNDIATIVDNDFDYFVPLGSDNVTVNIEVKVPKNAEINEVQNIEVSFLQVSSQDQGGFFAVASAFTQRIPVLVVGEPTESAIYQPSQEKQTSSLTWLAVAIIVLALIIFFVVRRRRNLKR